MLEKKKKKINYYACECLKKIFVYFLKRIIEDIKK